MATWADVRAILDTLPGVEVAPPGGERVARVKGARRLVRQLDEA